MKELQIIADRGAPHLAPENTIPAFRMAMVLKVHMIKTDVRLSLDGVPVICHDPTLERVTGDKVPVDYLTLRELREYDFGAWFSDEFKGVRIPSLEDALYFAKGDIPLLLEIKKDSPRSKGIEEKVIEIVTEKKMEDQVLISSLDRGTLERVRKLRPQIRVGVPYDGNDPWKPLLDFAVGLKAAAFCPREGSASPAMVLAFHSKGVSVIPYGVEDMSRVEELQKWEIDGVVTGRPEMFRE